MSHSKNTYFFLYKLKHLIVKQYNIMFYEQLHIKNNLKASIYF